MNCSEFEKVVMEVARSETRGGVMDAAVKHAALAHAQNCGRCATCLASEKSLTQGLRAVAAGDQTLGAPVSLENILCAAFRAQEDVAPAPKIVPHVVAASPFTLFWGRMRWAMAAAAAVVIIAFAIARGWQPAPTQQSIADGNVAPAPTVVAAPPARGEQVIVMPHDELVARDEPRVVRENRRPSQVKAIAANLRANRREGRVTVDVGEFVLDEPESLSANDFMVFDYARNLPPADSTQLMRVRMPRAKLAPLGIQLPREARNNDFVNADFLVGSDGVPRAIRVANR